MLQAGSWALCRGDVHSAGQEEKQEAHQAESGTALRGSCLRPRGNSLDYDVQ